MTPKVCIGLIRLHTSIFFSLEPTILTPDFCHLPKQHEPSYCLLGQFGCLFFIIIFLFKPLVWFKATKNYQSAHFTKVNNKKKNFQSVQTHSCTTNVYQYIPIFCFKNINRLIGFLIDGYYYLIKFHSASVKTCIICLLSSTHLRCSIQDTDFR